MGDNYTAEEYEKINKILKFKTRQKDIFDELNSLNNDYFAEAKLREPAENGKWNEEQFVKMKHNISIIANDFNQRLFELFDAEMDVYRG